MSERRPPYVERAAIVTGPAAFLLARLLPREEAARRLEQAGFRDERWREPVLATLEAIRQAGDAWHADAEARAPATADLGSSVLPTSGQGAPLEPMHTMTVTEAAAALDLGPRRVRQMIDDGTLPARRPGWAWEIDAAAVAAVAAERSEAA